MLCCYCYSLLLCFAVHLMHCLLLVCPLKIKYYFSKKYSCRTRARRHKVIIVVQSTDKVRLLLWFNQQTKWETSSGCRRRTSALSYYCGSTDKVGNYFKSKTPNDTYNSSTLCRNFSGTTATNVLVVLKTWYLIPGMKK